MLLNRRIAGSASLSVRLRLGCDEAIRAHLGWDYRALYSDSAWTAVRLRHGTAWTQSYSLFRGRGTLVLCCSGVRRWRKTFSFRRQQEWFESILPACGAGVCTWPWLQGYSAF
jgi:hypothetical protein